MRYKTGTGRIFWVCGFEFWRRASGYLRQKENKFKKKKAKRNGLKVNSAPAEQDKIMLIFSRET